ncbi:MAG: AMP-binding protein [Clostridia bacterium]|nr:AMP-binding protein [Clostridia bacterium]
MPIYETYTGCHRDSFTSLADAQKNFKLTWPENFNFAYDVIDVLAAEKPDKEALVWVSRDFEEKRFTFKDISDLSNKAANYFTEVGLRKGDFVLLVMKCTWLFWPVLMGLHKIGAVAVPASKMLTRKDYVYRANAGRLAAAIITGDGDCTEQFDAGMDAYETIRYKFVTGGKEPVGGGWLDIEAGIAGASAAWTRPTGEAATRADDIMMMCFSSGTTGYPKMIAHDFTYPLGHIMTGVFWHRVVDGGLHFTISDTGWQKAFWGKLYGQWFGESAIFVYDYDKFDGKNILHLLEKYRITTFCVPPTMYRLILQNDVSKYDLSSITHCCTAGEALNPEIFNEWKRATGLEIHEGFGQSETAVMLCTISPWMKPCPGSMGLPAPGWDVRILDEDGNECAPGVTGEICVRAPSREERPRGLLTCYYLNEEETAESWHDGFYHTGDTAFRDERGLYHYVGRNDDVIKSSGYRIGPFEVESVLLEHPAVLEVAVTGIPDAVRGFCVKATIVLQKGYTPSEELVKELQNYVKKNTAPYKYPRVVEFWDELPKTFSGKIRRTEIRQMDMKKYGK